MESLWSQTLSWTNKTMTSLWDMTDYSKDCHGTHLFPSLHSDVLLLLVMIYSQILLLEDNTVCYHSITPYCGGEGFRQWIKIPRQVRILHPSLFYFILTFFYCFPFDMNEIAQIFLITVNGFLSSVFFPPYIFVETQFVSVPVSPILFILWNLSFCCRRLL